MDAVCSKGMTSLSRAPGEFLTSQLLKEKKKKQRFLVFVRQLLSQPSLTDCQFLGVVGKDERSDLWRRFPHSWNLECQIPRCDRCGGQTDRGGTFKSSHKNGNVLKTNSVRAAMKIGGLAGGLEPPLDITLQGGVYLTASGPL